MNPKVILITGCSSGFGLLTAVRLAARGHRVWATMRDTARQEPLVAALAQKGTRAFIRSLDVTQLASIEAVIQEIQHTHGRIDVLINNAGYGCAGFFEDLTQAQIRAQMEVNFFGVQNVCRAVIPLMREQGQGKIINISSIAGQVATPCLGAYNASKWALEAFSESLYFELSLFGIAVVLVEPGSYPTAIFTRNAQYAHNFDNAQSPYFAFSQRLKQMATGGIAKFKRNPDDVAFLIENIVHTARPRLRYVSDISSQGRLWIQKILPPSWTAFVFRKWISKNLR